ncbi:uncharacterized protein METZ01_LOCUS140055, partial [marine metagenome]
MVTSAQAKHYREQGYLIVEDVFAESECAELRWRHTIGRRQPGLDGTRCPRTGI